MATKKVSGAGKSKSRPRSRSSVSTPQRGKALVLGGLLLFGTLFGGGMLALRSGTIWPGDYNQGLFAFTNAFLYGGSENELVVYTASRSNEPLPNEDVKVTLTNSSGTYELFAGATSSSGILATQFVLPPQPGTGRTVRLTISSGEESITKELYVYNQVNYRGGFSSETGSSGSGSTTNGSAPPEPAVPARMYLSLDKPRYQPGQTIHLRTLSFWEGGVNLQNVTYEIFDPNNNKLFKKVLVPNKFGVTSLDYPLNDILPQGDFEITVTSGDSAATKSVPVERYVLPKFDVQMTELASWYSVSDVISGELGVKYFFGKPVDGTARIIARTTQRALYYWDGTAKTQISGYREILNSTFPVTGGKCTFQIPAAESSGAESSYDYDLVIVAEVKDTGGHTERKNFTTVLTAQPYTVTAITETPTPGQPYVLTAVVRDVLGRPVKGAAVHLKPDNQGQGADVGSAVSDTRGLARISFTVSDDYYMYLSTDCPKVNKRDYSVSSNYGLGAPNAIKVTADKRFYSTGDTARITVLADPKDDLHGVAGLVSADVMVDGISVLHKDLTLENARASFSFKVTEDMAPTLEVEVSKLSMMSYGSYYGYYYYYGYSVEKMPGMQQKPSDVYIDRYTMARDRMALGVGVRSQLDVFINASKGTLRPGEGVELLLSTFNGSKPVSAALAIAIVDEALLAMGGESAFDEVRNDLMKNPGYEQFSVYSYVWGGFGIMPLFNTKMMSDYRPDSGRLDYSSSVKTGVGAHTEPNAKTVDTYALGIALFGVLGYFGIIGLGIKYRKTLVALVGVLVLTVALLGALTPLMTAPKAKNFTDTSQPVTFTQYTSSGYNYGYGMEDSSRNSNGLAPGGVMPPSPGPVKAMGGGQLEGSGTGGGQLYTSSPGGFMAPSKEVTVRTWFPELWYWNPLVVTDDNGQASIHLNAPDSITSWRIDALASTTDGRIGVGNGSLLVFQPFFVDPDLPVSVVRNDRFTFKVQVYNYEPSAKSVTVKLFPADWFQTVGDTFQTVAVNANSVSWVQFTIVAKKVGTWDLSVSGSTDTREDIVARQLRVEPDGKLRVDIRNGLLQNISNANLLFSLDARRVAASELAYLKLQSSVESIIVNGAEGFINVVCGCGEQSTSGLSVDIMAYRNYVKGKTDPANLTRYQDILNKGIQHEAQYLSTDTGGNGRAIVWHGGEKPDIWLTAWAIQAYKDLKDAGFTVDEKIIPDLQKYLASAQAADGSWKFPDVGHWSINSQLESERVAATAYITRALLYSGMSPSASAITKGKAYLEANLPGTNDMFTVALGLDALELAQGSDTVRSGLLDKLAAGAHDEGNGALSWKYQSASSDKYYRADNTVETTGYAVMALARSGTGYAQAQAGAKYLVLSRAEGGCYGSTHNTAVAFQALNSISEITPLKELAIDVLVDGVKVDTITVNQQNRDLTFLTDLRPWFTSTDGSVASRIVNVTLRSSGEGGVFYHVYTKQNIEWASASLTPADSQAALALQFSVNYSASSAQVGSAVSAVAKVSYIGGAPAVQMLLVDLKAPTGFQLDESDFRDMLSDGTISYYETRGTSEIYVYLDMVARNEVRTLSYSLAATGAATSLLQNVKAWDMYNTTSAVELAPVAFTSA